MSISNKVLVQSWKDYNPEIVKINETKLMNLHFSSEEKAVLAENEIDALKNKDLKNSVRFLIGLNSINYQFWDLVNGEFVRYQNKGQIGALGSFAGFVELFEILEKENFNKDKIDNELIAKCFGNISDKERRIEILKEALDVKNFEKVYTLINEHITNQGFNVELAEKIANILPKSYNDPYLKKIQLALYEISHVYESKGKNINCEITVAADYQLPKVLEGMGILEYSQDLMKKIDAFELINPDSEEERAIRAATIIACEKISYEHNISIPALDRILWLARNNFKDKKFHLTKTTNY